MTREPYKGPRPKLQITPCDFAEAVEFVRTHHRHHLPPVGHKFSVACADGDKVVGVAMVGRPVARGLQDGFTLEVNRVATDGTPNACSMLYRTCWRATRAMGYRKLITYTLPQEGGASLRASGFTLLGEAGGQTWVSSVRPRVDKYPLQTKFRWEITG